jgi:hypothetical protein
MRTAPRSYALPYPAVFDAAVAVLGVSYRVTVQDRTRGHVTAHGRMRHQVSVFVGAVDSTSSTVVIDVSGPFARRKTAQRIDAELARYLGYYYRPAS